MLTSRASSRAFAAAWFALAATIPVCFYLLIDSGSSGRMYKLTMIVGPVLAAGIAGALLGARILDEKKIGSAWRALCGLATAGSAYLIFFVFEVWAVVLYNRDAGVDGIFNLVYMIAIMFAIGLLILGWLIALVGAAAGSGLYVFQKKATCSRAADDIVSEII